jgi:outer membrane protein OmpA-like peptidoglycan-associated protein
MRNLPICLPMVCLLMMPHAMTAQPAQAPSPLQQPGPRPESGSMPIFRVTVVSRTTKAINYHHRSGSTRIDFRGTPLMPYARGEAKVESKQGVIKVDAEMEHLRPASQYGPEYLTYVMWAVTPEGRATNLGEVLLNGDKSKLNATTELQSFGLIVTAEPYFAVTQPSDVVVMENFVRYDTAGIIEQIDAKYELLPRGGYVLNVNPAELRPIRLDSKTPLELHEARNAVRIAQWAGADRYAPDTFQKARIGLENAEGYLVGRAGKKPIGTVAREAVQMAEDARIITLKKIEEQRLAEERAAAADRESRARAEAERQALRRRQADEQRVAAQAEADRLAREKRDVESQRAQVQAEAERLRRESEAARIETARISREKSELEAARQAAQADAERARLDAKRAENEKTELRAQLLRQLNLILETRDTARGLIVNMSDVLFDTGRHSLRPGAREKLAKVAGITLAHPGLNLEVEGHTDSVGGDDYNQQLSERRAQSVRDYLVQQGVSAGAITAIGFGKTQPVASNQTAEGRQRNRRVELVVSGEIIGTPLGSISSQTPGSRRPPDNR